jgi:hypothetical protein
MLRWNGPFVTVSLINNVTSAFDPRRQEESGSRKILVVVVVRMEEEVRTDRSYQNHNGKHDVMLSVDPTTVTSKANHTVNISFLGMPTLDLSLRRPGPESALGPNQLSALEIQAEQENK